MKEFPHRHYRVIERLKHSPASSTFVVKSQTSADDSVILKLYSGSATRSKLSVLEDDLRWQRGLVHPHLLGIATAGTSGRNSFFTTRQFASDTLDLSKATPTQITQLLDAICFLHKHGRPHGRIKPTNLFTTQGTVRLADMGLVDSDESSSLDYIRFTAPEVLLGAVPTFESDFYSLGAILYRIYAGRDPFDDSLSENLKAKYLQARIPTIRTLSGLRGSVGLAIDGLLHRNPRHRAVAIAELIREMPFAAESASRVPMVGRRDTVEQLYLKMASTATRSLTVELIEGDAGIGKSRLIEELQFRCNFHNSEFYMTACTEQTEQGLAPILRLVRTVLNRHFSLKRVSVRTLLGSFENNLAPFFDDLAEKSSDDGIEHPSERVVQDLIGLISLFSRKDALRLCIEDIDKAEPATRGFIRQLCYRASELNVRLILTCRNSAAAIVPGEIEALLGRTFTRISLGPLTRSESLDLSRYLESNAGKQKQALNRAGGNPLWLLEHASNENSQALTTSVYTLIREEADTVLIKIVQVLAVNRAFATPELLARVTCVDSETVRQSLVRLRTIGAVRQSNHLYDLRFESLRSAVESEMSSRARRKIHAALYEALSAEKAVAEERLADAASKGGLWERASVHFTELAQLATKRGDNVAAVDYFGRLIILLRRLKKALPLEAQCEFAICLTRIGKTARAEQMFERLLTNSNLNEELRIRLALFAKRSETDCSRLDHRLKLLQYAIEYSKYDDEHSSILLSRFCNTSITAGDLAAASDALNRAKFLLRNQTYKTAEVFTKAAEGFLLMNRGCFQEASEIYRTLSGATWTMSAAILANRGVCLEHLGRIRSAIVLQLRAYRLASKAAHLFGRIQCLANLGTFEVKLGELRQANRHFEETKQQAIELYRTTGVTCKGIEAEQVCLNILEGQYGIALRHLRAALNSERLFKRERLQLYLLQSELLFMVGADVRASDIEQIASEGSWSDSPLYAVQLALLRSRTKSTPGDAMLVLDDALETARRASLLYEVCRLELEVADRLHESEPAGAKPHADEALRISKKNGYRPLQCRALLLRALCSRHDKEKEHYLGLCLKLATSVGIPEIVSESSYHLGVLFESMNQLTASRECLANSTRLTSEIADKIPARFRLAYLARPWRRDARKRYEEQLLDQPIKLHLAETDPGPRDNHYFRALYRISIAASSSRTTDDFLRELLPAMGLSRAGIVAMLTLDGHTSWHSHGVVLTDALRHRVLSVAVKSRGQARYNSTDRWIPFRSTQFSGGICVLSRKKNQMGEEEMEFFTILGIFASSALDQIHNRVAPMPTAIPTDAFHGIIGNSRPIRDLCAHISRISNNSATVLIQGETGTGKELVAHAIHKLSSRSRGPFIPIDCGAITESLLESELFGSKRGSFTGAIADRPGVFEAAHKGTLFLDEISNMNLAMQAKLLRVLQEKEIRRVGETRNRPVDARLIAASNTNLKQLVAEGAFRQDLLFRLNVIAVSIPPLRARREDIPVLAFHFLKQLNAAQKTRKVFGPEALEPLLTHSFPGNVRELQNSVERGFFTASGQTIPSIPIEVSSGDEAVNEVRKWLTDLADGRRNFWTEIHDRYKRRDISREKVVALIDLGLRTTRGSYKNLASLLHIQEREYRRLMDFLRRNNCLLDFRPYRKVASLP